MQPCTEWLSEALSEAAGDRREISPISLTLLSSQQNARYQHMFPTGLLSGGVGWRFWIEMLHFHNAFSPPYCFLSLNGIFLDACTDPGFRGQWITGLSQFFIMEELLNLFAPQFCMWV